MRAPEHAIPAPPFPGKLPWVNVASLRMDKQRGRPVLVEFWDFCRVNSLRTMPYLKAWHERYAGDGLRVVGVHTGGFLPARVTENVVAAVERLGIEYPVVIDEQLELWDLYGNEGWPARYLWDQQGALYSLHYGEGAYQETEREIQALLGVERALVEPAAARGRRGRPAPGADRGPAGPLQRALRGRRRVGGAGGRGRGDGQRPHARGVRAGLRAAARAPAPHRGRARAGDRRRRDLPRHLLHPGGRSSGWPRSPSIRMSRGGAPSSSTTAVPGQ